MATTAEVETFPVRVREMRLEAEGVMLVGLEPVGRPAPAWEPGAHVDVEVRPGLTRSYSLCGTPGAPELRIGVLRERESRGASRHVHEALRVGDLLTARAPRNHFALEPAPAYLFIAGGVGITPLLPMIAAVDEASSPWTLGYAGRTASSMAFAPALSAHGDRVILAASDQGQRLDVPALVEAAPADALVYVCGPERLRAAVREALEATGRGDRLRTELFAAPEVEYEPGGAFEVELASSGVTLEVAPDASILDVVADAGVDVLTDCREGICGSCETSVLAGEVEHRDFVLTAQEREANDCMMICVSRSRGPRLVLDL